MYLYEERIRAVKLYIKLGQRIGPTLRQLGYPTKNSLKGCSPDNAACARHDAAFGCGRLSQQASGQ